MESPRFSTLKYLDIHYIFGSPNFFYESVILCYFHLWEHWRFPSVHDKCGSGILLSSWLWLWWLWTSICGVRRRKLPSIIIMAKTWSSALCAWSFYIYLDFWCAINLTKLLMPISAPLMDIIACQLPRQEGKFLAAFWHGIFVTKLDLFELELVRTFFLKELFQLGSITVDWFLLFN